MSVTLTGTTSIAVASTYTDTTQTISQPVDSSNVTYTKTYTSGTGSDQVDLIYRKNGTLTAAALDVDLSGGVTDVFGNTITMVKVKDIFIVNLSTTTTEVLSIGGDANGLVNWVGNVSDIVKVGPGSAFYISSAIDGFAVTAGTGDILQIDPGAATISYKLVIRGTSA